MRNYLLILMLLSAHIIETFAVPVNGTMPVVEEAVEASTNCQYDEDCGHGSCAVQYSRQFPNGTRVCECNSRYVSRGGVCNYEKRDKVTAFLVSFFVGLLGVDWFYLARGVPKYNGLGVLKLFTVGGCGIWWLADWIRILADDFDDGNGVELSGW